VPVRFKIQFVASNAAPVNEITSSGDLYHVVPVWSMTARVGNSYFRVIRKIDL